MTESAVAAGEIGAEVEVGRPLLSVCVPTYGRQTTVTRTLDSLEAGGVLNPSLVELIIGDNSPDLSEPVVRPYFERWPGPKAYLANRPTISAQENFNQCIRRARGRYVLFVHDDDFLLPGGLEKVLGELRAFPDRPVYLFGVDVVDAQGRIRRRQRPSRSEELGPRDAMRRLLTDSAFVRMPVLVVARHAYETAGMFDERVGNPADFDLFVRLFARFGVRTVATTTAAYTIHPGASTTGMFRSETIDVVLPIFGRAAATGLLRPAELRRCKADWFHQFILGGAYRSLRDGDVDGARAILSLFRHPAVRSLGLSPRWLAVRVCFELVNRLPHRIGGTIMKVAGRLSPERFWMP